MTRIIRQNAPRSLGQAITRIMTRTLKRHGFSSAQQAQLALHWEDIARPSSGSAPDRIRSGVLTIHAQSGTSLEIQHNAPQIIARVNEVFGYNAVKRIKIIQRPPHRSQ